MKTHNFENLDVWKRACRLSVNVCVAFKESKEFAIKDQIVRSAISIPSNIAEGAERATDKDFARFLDYSKGSCGELRTQLYIFRQISRETGAEAPEGFDEMINETQEISRMLGALIAKLRSEKGTKID